jgi:hypothetical protein
MTPDEIKEKLEEAEREYNEIDALGNPYWLTN